MNSGVVSTRFTRRTYLVNCASAAYFFQGSSNSNVASFAGSSYNAVPYSRLFQSREALQRKRVANYNYSFMVLGGSYSIVGEHVKGGGVSRRLVDRFPASSCPHNDMLIRRILLLSKSRDSGFSLYRMLSHFVRFRRRAFAHVS